MIATLAIIVLFGVLLMMMETFLPGWIAGLLGAGCILTAVLLVATSDEFSAWTPLQRGAVACGIIAFSTLAVLVWLRYFAVKVWRRTFTLEESVPPPPAETQVQRGAEGVALTELRPLGRADFSGARREVRCRDGFAPAGSRVQVVDMEPGNLVVRVV